MNDGRMKHLVAAIVAAGCAGNAGAFDFSIGDTRVAWDSQMIAGLGLRTEGPGCDLSGGAPGQNGCAGGGNNAQWGNGSLGDLNYKKGNLYSGYGKVTSELLLTMPDQWKAMVRGSALYDEMALHTSETPITDSARRRVAPNFMLLDLWVSKAWTAFDQSGHVRVGNQVLNWGESYFAAGGLNASNAFDLQKLLTPGVQLKEAVLPAPMISVAQGLGHGVDFEAYYQVRWNHDLYPAVGTFWSTSNQLGAGAIPAYNPASNFNLGTYPGDPNGVMFQYGPDRTPSNSGQGGLKVHWKPAGSTVDLGFYYENYHDKTPVSGFDAAAGAGYFRYLENRKLFGFSANAPVGDWSIGFETSYRPHDAVALTGCFTGNGAVLDAQTSASPGSCQNWKDMTKWQHDVVAQLNLQPSDYPFLNRLGANFAVLTFEGTLVQYPDVNDNGLVTSVQGGQSVVQGYAAGYGAWLQNPSASTPYQTIASRGTRNSGGLTLDYNWTYDGNLIPGWQVTPGVTFFYAVNGYTPNYLGQFLQGAKSLNFYTYFNANPAVWQSGINFTHFFGGNQISQPYGDRDNIGLFLTRNF